jgi:hypothetical protein
VKTIYDYDDFGPELNKSGYFEDDLKLVCWYYNPKPK